MNAAVDAGEGALAEGESLVVTGERNLLHADDFASNMERLRRLFDLFEQKTSILHLLDLSQSAQGVSIYIGSESGLVPLDECSVVTAPYDVNGKVVGTLGVIGPTRMAYERIMPIVDLTAKLLSNAMTPAARGRIAFAFARRRASVHARSHAAHRRAARQPGHARRAHDRRGAPVPRAVPLRSARDRDLARSCGSRSCTA